MIDNDTEYLALKNQCNNGLYQFSQPSGYDKSKWKDAPDTVNCPHWIFSEEYALTHKDFKLRWHTPYVIDGGISFHAEIHGDTLEMKTIQDGIVELGVIDRKSLKLVGVCTSQILDFYWGGGIGKILSDRPTVKDLAPLRKRLLKGVDRFRRTLSLSLVACQLREKENQFTPKEWDWIKAAHRNPKYALRMISSFMKA